MEIAKPSISFRCGEKLKGRLDREAEALGVTRSDLCEQRIALSYSVDEQLGELRLENQDLSIKNLHLTEEIKMLRAIDELTRTNHFQQLFGRVKGRTETITINGTAETIAINTPHDLLRVITYSFTIKKC